MDMMMKIIGILTSGIIIITGIAFSVLNAQSVSVNYLIGKTELPLAVLLLISFIVGMTLALLIFVWPLLKLKNQNRSIKAKLKALEQNIS
jgi:putative membrane protein